VGLKTTGLLPYRDCGLWNPALAWSVHAARAWYGGTIPATHRDGAAVWVVPGMGLPANHTRAIVKPLSSTETSHHRIPVRYSC